MAFSRCRELYVGYFTPSPSTTSDSLSSIGSSTPRSLGGDPPFITPLGTLSARFESLDMNRTIERFLTFKRPDPPVDVCTHPPAPTPRVSPDRLHQFHQRHSSCPPEISNLNVRPNPNSNYLNHTREQRQHSNPPPPSARTRKAAFKTSPAYHSRAADKLRAAAKTRSKVSATRSSQLTASAIACGATPSTIQAPATAASLRRPRAKPLPPKNTDALTHLFTKCVRHYTDSVPGPKVYSTTEELMYIYREILDQHKPPEDGRWMKFARPYVTEDGKELYQCLLLKEGAKEDCACQYGQTKQAVRRHINDVHLNIRNWKCPFDGCNTAFKQRCTLKIHIFVKHTGETPYLCQYCTSRFSDPAQRNKHYKTNHPDREHPKRIKQAHDLPMNEADVYGCFFCPERCADSRSRAIHCQEYHPDKFVPSVISGGEYAPALVLDDEDDEECDHKGGYDCDFD
ncbi:hypothetical protein D9619_001140 [Psilocybe cf. subviscida]|uniref:C2H2-type domain-containing protein n=1 Tax=Psilocybe cf. subviscida TaxID=2480587 RepID=A0A8H5F3I7_9AGAR|nr:hypothetical protein D9619_001140 [Psilocybe cf. subviscida]